MDNMVLVLIVALVCIAVVAVVVMLKRKGVDTGEVYKSATLFLNGADQITDFLKEVAPASALVNIVDKIVDYAKVAVANAEQLCLIDEIDSGDRKDAALAYLYEALKLAGYEITPEVKKIAEGALEAAVLALGHPATGELLTVTHDVEVTI